MGEGAPSQVVNGSESRDGSPGDWLTLTALRLIPAFKYVVGSAALLAIAGASVRIIPDPRVGFIVGVGLLVFALVIYFLQKADSDRATARTIRRIIAPVFWAVAVTFIALLAAFLFWIAKWLFVPDDDDLSADERQVLSLSETHPPQPTQTITTDIGERQSVQLANGTGLDLNTRSIAHVDLDPTSRRVTLERGETIMNVADDNLGPWVLRCDDLEIEMRAAKVHLRCEPTESVSRLDVISGSASVRRAAEIENALPGHPRFQPLLVQAGEFLWIRANVGKPARFNPAEVDRRLAWTQGMVIFQGDSLKDAVAELNRYNKRQLVIGDESISSLVPGGTFNVTDIDEFANSLSKVFGVRVLRMRADGAGPGVIVLVGRDYSGI